MRFYNFSTKSFVNVPESKVKYSTKIVDTRSNLGVREITRAYATVNGKKVSKIISSIEV